MNIVVNANWMQVIQAECLSMSPSYTLAIQCTLDSPQCARTCALFWSRRGAWSRTRTGHTAYAPESGIKAGVEFVLCDSGSPLYSRDHQPFGRGCGAVPIQYSPSFEHSVVSGACFLCLDLISRPAVGYCKARIHATLPSSLDAEISLFKGHAPDQLTGPIACPCRLAPIVFSNFIRVGENHKHPGHVFAGPVSILPPPAFE